MQDSNLLTVLKTLLCRPTSKSIILNDVRDNMVLCSETVIQPNYFQNLIGFFKLLL